MDEIKFKLGEFEFGIDESQTGVVEIFINNKSLMQIIKEQETPFAIKDKQANLAGDYAFLSLRDFKREFLDELNNSEVALVGCECGFWECWAVSCEVMISEEFTEFSHFHHSHRKHWGYELNFKFSSKQFLDEVENIKKQIVNLI